jgi:hypothetical protein
VSCLQSRLQPLLFLQHSNLIIFTNKLLKIKGTKVFREAKLRLPLYTIEDLKRHVLNLQMSGIGNDLKQSTPTGCGFKSSPV